MGSHLTALDAVLLLVPKLRLEHLVLVVDAPPPVRFFFVSFIVAPKTPQRNTPFSSRPHWATPRVAVFASSPVQGM